MTVTVRLFARVRELAGRDAVELELPGEPTVAAALAALAAHFPCAAALIARSAVAVNGEYAAADQVIQPADEAALIPPVSGGC